MRQELDFEVDKIVNSIEDAVTGITYKTNVLPVTAKDIRRILKKDAWGFNWKEQFKEPKHQVYKLVLKNRSIIQGLISTKIDYEEKFIELPLIESAHHNKGANKKFKGVAPNLVAFACKMSWDMGFGGVVSFRAKTNLIDHYIQTLGAELIYWGGKMAIYESSAKKLIHSYYKDFFNEKR